MPVTIVPTDDIKPTELKIRAVNIRTANGRDVGPTGVTIPAGTILVAATLAGVRDGVWLSDLDSVVIPDVAAWVAALAGAGDPHAAGAARRAKAVADTEAAGAVAAGQAVVRDTLSRTGHVAVTEWVTRDDEKVRFAHREMDGVQVRAGGLFDFGNGVKCRFPGDPTLPPELRINCRCKAVTVYVAGA